METIALFAMRIQRVENVTPILREFVAEMQALGPRAHAPLISHIYFHALQGDCTGKKWPWFVAAAALFTRRDLDAIPNMDVARVCEWIVTFLATANHTALYPKDVRMCCVWLVRLTSGQLLKIDTTFVPWMNMDEIHPHGRECISRALTTHERIV